MEYVTLRNGIKMPVVGYGVYLVSEEECERCVLDALSVGYRSIDTAQAYYNEKQVGDAIRKSGIPREDIFLTTKVWYSNYGEESTKRSVMESLEKLQTDYLDLMLLHQPYNDTYGAWRALERLYEEGVIKAIGVSNFYPDRVVDFATFCRITPMVNQIELHPYRQQPDALKWNSKYGITLEAWAPLGQGRGELLSHPTLKAIGEKYGKTAAQVMLRWNIQRGVVVIPKSTHIERMRENLDIFNFALTEDDMQQITQINDIPHPFHSHEDPDVAYRITHL